MRASLGALTALVFALLPACSHGTSPANNPSRQQRGSLEGPSLAEQNIPILEANRVERPVARVGEVSADARAENPVVMARLRHKAFALGANALLDLKYHPEGKHPHYTAVAAKLGKRAAVEEKK